MVTTFTVVYDANVLVPALLRDLLLRLSVEGLVRARWSTRILDELDATLHKVHPQIPTEKRDRLRAAVTRSVPDCIVEDYERLECSLELPDPDDVHILAAAIRCNAQAIVTFNLKDYPEAQLAPFNVEAKHPDDFVLDLIDLDPVRVYRIIEDQARQFRSPPMTTEEVLHGLSRFIPRSVGELSDSV